MYLLAVTFSEGYHASVLQNDCPSECGNAWLVIIVLLIVLSALFLLGSSDIRLVGGKNQYEGRVKVFRSGEWQTVCDNSWDIQEAEVVCRELGYGYAVLAIQGATFGQGSGGQWKRNWSCNGNETRLADCSSNSVSCSHSEDASAICSANGETYFSACPVCCVTPHH